MDFPFFIWEQVIQYGLPHPFSGGSVGWLRGSISAGLQQWPLATTLLEVRVTYAWRGLRKSRNWAEVGSGLLQS